MRELLYNPYFEISAALFLSLIIIHFLKNNTIWNMQNKSFIAFAFVSLLGTLFDIASVWTITYADVVPVWINYIVNTGYLLFQVLIATCFLLFSIVSIKKVYGESRKIFVLLSPALILIVLLITNIFSEILFYFDENNKYCHAPTFYLIYLFLAYCCICTIYLLIRYRKSLSKAQIALFAGFLLLVASYSAIQALSPMLLLSGTAAALGVISVYLTFQNPTNYIDKLTGIYGREAFIIIASEIFGQRTNDSRIILVDICNLKKINSYLGIYGGDMVICMVAKYLSGLTEKKNEWVCRLSGSAFIVIVSKNRFRECEKKITERFSKPWHVLDADIEVQKNLTFIAPDDVAGSPEELLTVMENVLVMEANRGGSGRKIFVDKAVLEQIRRRSIIENALNAPDLGNTIKIYYQPIYSISQKRFVSAEALSRMFTREIGNVRPDEFIPVAEQSGLITRLGTFLLKEVCRTAKATLIFQKGYTAIDVNLSVIECMQPDIFEKIQSVTSGYKNIFENGFRINFEITETVASNASEPLRDLMKALPQHKYSFSLDDYGSGYSNNDTLIALPFKTVKIDKNMLYACERFEKAGALYSGIAKTFKDMGLEIIAEGVETEEQLNIVKAAGIDLIQGYYFSKPLSEKQFEQTINKQEETLCTLQQNF